MFVSHKNNRISGKTELFDAICFAIFECLRKLIFILFFIPLAAFSQELTQTIRGTVVDKQTQSPLPGAIVQVLGVEGKNTITDEDGKFRIELVPLGRRPVKVSLLSYKERMYTLNLTSGKEAVLTVELEESVMQGQEVVVTAEVDKSKTNNRNTTVSSRGFTIEETSRYAGSRNDPARMAANFAGVSGANDSRNDIIIRGNSPLGVLWRLNGMDIPNPNHFGSLGSTGGPISILNNNTLDNSDFLTSAFPADYGNAIAGVFDLKMRPGNNEKYEFLGQMGFNGFELAAEGPLSKKKSSSFLVDYRYSTLQVFKTLGINFGTGAAVPQYQDLTYNFTLPTKKAGKFTFYGIGGMSYISLLDKDRDPGGQDLYGYKGIDTYFRSNVGVAGLAHTYIINESSYLRSGLAASGQFNRIIADNVLFDSTGVPTGQTRPNYHSTTYTNKYSFNSVYNKKFNARNFITTGIYLDMFQTLLADSVDNADSAGYHVLRHFSGNSMLVQAFVNWQHKFSDQFTLNSGVRYINYLLNNTYNVEPRMGLRYSFRPNQSFSVGAGLHSQVQPLYVYFSSVYNPATQLSEKTNINLGLTKSAHGVLAYDVNLGKNARIKTEAYYQYLFNVPVKYSQPYFSVLNLGANFESPNVDSLVNKGTGENYGLEFTLEKFYSKGYYYLLTASLFESYYYGSDHVRRNTAFNGNYVFNVLGGKEFKVKTRHTFAIDFKVTYAGGKRYTPIDLTASQYVGAEVKDYRYAYQNQYPDYFRLDIKPSYRYNMKKVTLELNCDFQNVTGHSNVFQQTYDPQKKKLVTDYQLKFFFIPQFRLLF